MSPLCPHHVATIWTAINIGPKSTCPTNFMEIRSKALGTVMKLIAYTCSGPLNLCYHEMYFKHVGTLVFRNREI